MIVTKTRVKDIRAKITKCQSVKRSPLIFLPNKNENSDPNNVLRSSRKRKTSHNSFSNILSNQAIRQSQIAQDFNSIQKNLRLFSRKNKESRNSVKKLQFSQTSYTQFSDLLNQKPPTQRKKQESAPKISFQTILKKSPEKKFDDYFPKEQQKQKIIKTKSFKTSTAITKVKEKLMTNLKKADTQGPIPESIQLYRNLSYQTPCHSQTDLVNISKYSQVSELDMSPYPC